MRMSNLSMGKGWKAKTPPHFRVTGISTLGVTTCRTVFGGAFYAFAEVAAAGAGIVGASPIGP
jgi:hypothetical protein